MEHTILSSRSRFSLIELLKLLYLAICELKSLLIRNIKLDRYLICFIIFYLLLTLPAIFHGISDVKLMDFVANDDPFITMQLDGMTTPPYGNPANYLKVENQSKIPSYYYELRYPGIVYYGATYLNIAFLIFAPLKMIGFKTIPTAPIILRLLSCFFGLLGLMVIYNFAKNQLGWVAAIIAGVFLITENYYIIFSSLIHPDSLLYFLSFFTLIVAVEYSESGRLATLIALGMLTGLAFGTKLGGAWFLPMALFSIYYANNFASLREVFSRSYFRKALMLGITTVVFFAISTPYALMDSYFFTTWLALYKNIIGESILYSKNITIANWTKDFFSYYGLERTWFAVSALFIVLFGIFLKRFTAKTRKCLVLIICMLASCMAFYAVQGSLWVQLQYLVPGSTLLAVLSGFILHKFCENLQKLKLLGKALTYLFLLGTITLFLINHDRLKRALWLQMGRINLEKSANVAMGSWAIANIPHNSKILYDGMAYFDPSVFKDQLMGTAVLRYAQILEYKPDYLCITDWKGNWISELITTQHSRIMDPSGVSVRLYQDLLPAIEKIGPTQVPYISLVHVEKIKLHSGSWHQLLSAIFLPNSEANKDLYHDRTMLLFRIHPAFYGLNYSKSIDRFLEA